MVKRFRYGDILTMIVSKQSYSDDILGCPLVMSLWNIMISRSPCEPLNDGTSSAAFECHEAFNLNIGSIKILSGNLKLTKSDL